MIRLAIRLCVVVVACVGIFNPQYCHAQTPDCILDHLLICGRTRLAEALLARERDLPENRLVCVCGFMSSPDLYALSAHRAKMIAKKRVEITISRWIAILRLKKARSTFRAVSQLENNLDRDGFLSAGAKSLRHSIRCSFQAKLNPELQLIAEQPVFANRPRLDFMRCYVVASALITLDGGLINELDDMFVREVKTALEIERYTQWEAGIRRECAMLKTAISIVDWAFALINH